MALALGFCAPEPFYLSQKAEILGEKTPLTLAKSSRTVHKKKECGM